jgi:hypothetical protein
VYSITVGMMIVNQIKMKMLNLSKNSITRAYRLLLGQARLEHTATDSIPSLTKARDP